VGVFGFLREDQYDALIWTAANARGLDPLLVKAIVAQESGFQPNAFRAEPRIGDASRGLMQVLYGTARDMGYRGSADGLFDPATSIEYGTAWLAKQWVRYQYGGRQLTDAIAAYNAGTAVFDAPRGSYSNQGYVDGVLRYYQGYRNAEAQAPPSGGVPVAEILREQSAEPPGAEGGDPAATWWTDLTTSIWPAATSPAAPAAPSSDALSLNSASAEGESFFVWAGLALLGIAGILAFARGR